MKSPFHRQAGRCLAIQTQTEKQSFQQMDSQSPLQVTHSGKSHCQTLRVMAATKEENLTEKPHTDSQEPWCWPWSKLLAV